MLKRLKDWTRRRSGTILVLGLAVGVVIGAVFTASAVRDITDDETPLPTISADTGVLAEVIPPTTTVSPTPTALACQEDEVIAGEGDFSAGGWSEGWHCVPLDTLVEERLNGLDQTTKRPAEIAALEKRLIQALAMLEDLRALIESALKDW